MPSANVVPRSISIRLGIVRMKIYQWGQKRFKGQSLGTGCPWDRKRVPSHDKSPKNDSLQLVFEKITPGTFTRPYFLDGLQSECFSIDSRKQDHSAGLISLESQLEIARSSFQRKNRGCWKPFNSLLFFFLILLILF